MFNKMLVITLGVTGLSSVLLFLYFRNRLSDVEKKVDTMFNLIQSYETIEKQPQFTMQETPREFYEQQQIHEQQMHEQQKMQEQGGYHPNNELVQVSDRGDESSDSDDSESDSDEDYSSEEEEETTKPLVVKNESENIALNEEDVTTDLNEISLEKKQTQQEEVEEVEEEVTKNITLQSEVDLNTLKVSDLKSLCKEKGLSGYRNLRKNDLIELLSA